ncbi:hypothetical protein PR048_023595 [Dryococelus australis]|uniref:RNA-directed DNA polymerase n=1 Tax=Dryococelus australis TaxID=614101 RepID=A0ABQ9GUJ4_9NEOP|nr:hypothetical protein PR048_023595 [Dryococelus australis]
MYGARIFVPSGLRHERLQWIHNGHMGIVKCCRWAKESVWWPTISNSIKKLVQCVEQRGQRIEPTKMTSLPRGPWLLLGTGIFEIAGQKSVYIGGMQFIVANFQKFAKEYGFLLTTSNLKFAQLNGEAESAVKVEKNILSKSVDPNLG